MKLFYSTEVVFVIYGFYKRAITGRLHLFVFLQRYLITSSDLLKVKIVIRKHHFPGCPSSDILCPAYILCLLGLIMAENFITFPNTKLAKYTFM